METVMRETLEETGIDLSQFPFLGTLNVVNSNVAPDLEILPFVVLSEETPKVTLTQELCSYFWVSLEQLKRSKGKGRVHQREVPAYLVYNEVVWGLTFRMLNNLLELVDVANREV
jgi:8-oxo-dGTP pyrophosphatase MutT (NUDIX family)